MPSLPKLLVSLVFILCCLFLAAAPALGAIVYLDSFGSYGGGDGEFYYPAGIAIAPNGDVYVVGTGNRVQRFDSVGNYLSQWGSFGSGVGQFRNPSDIAVGSDGTVYVCDSGNNRIQMFNGDGTSASTWGSYGSDVGDFDEPNGIAVAADGTVYVTEEGNDRIQKFAADGSSAILFATTSSGLQSNPYGIAVAGNGSVYVGYSNEYITEFDADGVQQSEWGTRGNGDGELSSTRSIDVSAAGQVYVTDYGNCRVSRFDMQGNDPTQFGVQGSGDGEFNYPVGVAVANSGLVYVADTSNSRIQRFFDPDAWTTGYYPIDDDLSTPEISDAIINAGTLIGKSFVVGEENDYGFSGNLHVIGTGNLTLAGGTLRIGAVADVPTVANTIAIGAGGTLLLDGGATSFVARGANGTSGVKDAQASGNLDIQGGRFEITSSAGADLQGGTGGTGSTGGTGGTGGSSYQLTLGSGQLSLQGTLNTSGGIGGTGGAGSIGYAGDIAGIPGNGGNGGRGGTGGRGGSGSLLTLSGGQLSLQGTLNTPGGIGGTGGIGGNGGIGGLHNGDGGNGGVGGRGATGAQLTITGGLLSIQGTFNARGGRGGNGGRGSHKLPGSGYGAGGNGGQGGDGGSIFLHGGELVLAATATIDLSGGAGGSGGNNGSTSYPDNPTGSAGQAGAGGTLELDGGTLVLNGANLDDVLVAGTFDWKTGTVRVTGNATIDSGKVAGVSTMLAANRSLQIGQTLTIATGGTLELGDGSASVGSFGAVQPPGQFAIAADGAVTLDGGRLSCTTFDNTRGGTFLWNVGTLAFAGNLTVNSGSPLGIAGGDNITPMRTLEVSDTLIIEDGATFALDGGNITCQTVAINQDGIFALDGGNITCQTVAINQGGIFDLGNGTLTFLPAGSGELRMNGGMLRGDSTAFGPMFVDASFDYTAGTFHLTDAGGYTVGANDNLIDRLLGGNHINRTAGSNLIVDQTLTISEDKSIYVYGSLVEGGQIVNEGTVTVVQGQLATSDGLINNGDLLLVDSTVDGPVNNPAGEAINIIGDVYFNGLVSGGGGLFGSGIAHFDGGYAPGDSPAEVMLECSVEMGEAATLSIELGGTEAGQFDSIIAENDVTLDGLLDVQLIDGFELTEGDMFEIINVGGSLFGEFDGLEEGSLVGMFSGIGLFITYAGGDGNDVFLQSVPEPSTLLLLAIGVIAIVTTFTRRHTNQTFDVT